MRWQYPTCECAFTAEVVNGERTNIKTTSRCKAHGGTDGEAYAAAYADVRLMSTVTSRVREWTGKEPAWRFNEHRELVLTGISDCTLAGACAMLDRVKVE